MTSALGPMPHMRFIDKHKLTVDATYQRSKDSERSQKLVATIAAEFSWLKFQVLAVTQSLCIVDGQHRHAGAMQRDDVAEVPCLVLPTDDVAAAAQIFVALNRDRVALTPLALFKAELAAGNKEALQVVAVCKAAGAEALTYPMPLASMAGNQTQAISTLRAQVRTDAGRATRALRAAVKAGCGLSAAVLQVAFRALSAGMDEAALVTSLSGAAGAIAAVSHNTEVSRADRLYTAMTGAPPPKITKPAPAPKKVKKPFRFDRSKPSKVQATPVEIRGDVKVRKFEAGDFYTLVNRALETAGIKYEMVAGKAHRYRVRGKIVGLDKLVEMANAQRAKEGKELLTMPKGWGIARAAGKKRSAA